MSQLPMTTYTVKRGDSLSIIARDVLGNINLWPRLAAQNAIVAPYIISPGRVLTLPTLAANTTPIFKSPAVVKPIAKPIVFSPAQPTSPATSLPTSLPTSQPVMPGEKKMGWAWLLALLAGAGVAVYLKKRKKKG